MTKDRTYYENRLKETADRIYAEETEGMTFEQILQEKPEVFENINIVGFLSRIGFNFPEARALIPKILDSLDEDDANKVYELTWVSKSSQKMPYGGELMTAKLTRAQMIERIEWISNETFGKDGSEWSNWLEAFEADTPPWSWR